MKKLAKIALVGSLLCFMALPVLADLNDGLVAHYPFNGNANDASSNGNNGLVNGAVLIYDRFGNQNSAYSFDGEDDYIDVGDNLDQGNNNFSISAWFKTKNIDGISQYVVAKRSSTLGEGYSLNGINMSGYTDVSILDNNNYTYSQSTSPVNTNQWYHVVGIVDRANNNISLYVDGILNLTNKYSNVVGDISNDLPFYIGAKSVNENFFHGLIDDVRIYNRILSASEIQELYQSENNCATNVYADDFSGLWENGNGATMRINQIGDRSYSTNGDSANGVYKWRGLGFLSHNNELMETYSYYPTNDNYTGWQVWNVIDANTIQHHSYSSNGAPTGSVTWYRITE